MSSGVGAGLVALPCFRVVRRSVAGINICLVRFLEIGGIEAARKAVVRRARGLVDVEREVLERAIGDTLIIANAVAAEPCVWVEDGRLVERSDIKRLLPVGLCACVVALVLEKEFVGAHVETVPRQEGALYTESIVEALWRVVSDSATHHIVYHVRLNNVGVHQLVPSVFCTFDVQLRRR